MTISVIITVHNLEKFAGIAIESVLQQTKPADEIIVVDDGSTDDSVKAIKQFGSKVKLIEMGVNSGVLPAFLTGIKAASGDILCFLDGDDVWMPEKIEKVVSVFEKERDVMMVTHIHQWINKEGEVTGETDETHRNIERVVSLAKNTDQMDALLKNSILCYKGVWLGSAFCVRRSDLDLEVFEEWVSSMPGKELSHQDQPLAAFLIYSNPYKKISLINEALFKYRVYSTNSSGSSANVRSAIRTINRSIATVQRTKDIVLKNPSWKEENYMQRMKLLELEFYRDLYMNKRANALGRYFKLFSGYWRKDQKLKETKRLLACLFLGPSKFLRMKTNRRFSS